MKASMKYWFLGLGCLIFGWGFGQTPEVSIEGRIIGAQDQAPIEFATVAVMDANSAQPVGGAISASDGTFRVKGISISDFYVEIRLIGYATQTLRELEVQNGRVDLGTIVLEAEATELDEVEIRAEKSQTVFKLDKRVFNVGQDLSSAGASALEVLNNVPSVNVNIEGQISLRGNAGVQILINGKPSVLASDEGNALGTITADMIDRVEVITNPSAKYEAEGTAGIINIVLKKEERKGANGSVSLNTGWPHNHSLGFSVNRRTERFNLFSQFGAGYRSLPRYRENENRNLVDGSALRSEGTEFRDELFFNMTLGADYELNRWNVLTLSGSFAYEVEDQPSQTEFTRTDGAGVIESFWERTETTEATNPKWQYELQYKKQFADHEDHAFLFSAIGNFFGKDLASEFEDRFPTFSTFQQTQTDFSEARYTLKADYTQPFGDHWELETGSQYFIQDVSNDFTVLDLNNEIWIPNPSFTNLFEFDQKVLGVYATGAYEKGRWGTKLGLRVENTDVRTLLVNTQEENIQNYTNLFPTFHSSYKFSERISMQAGYSRRVFRPRLWNLNPFFNIRNQFNIRTGNPNLQPEFTDSYEVNGIWVLEKASLNLGVFHLYTTEVVERVSVPEFDGEDIINIVRPENIGTNRATGAEFNFKYEPSKRVTLTGDVNYQWFIREGTFDTLSFDFAADRWSSKTTVKVALPADIDVEATGNFNSRFQTVQGRTSGTAFLDLGLRKKLMGGKAVINLGVRDVFASRIDETQIEQGIVSVYSFSQRGRFMTLGFSYGFGKGEAMAYTGRRR